MKLTRLVQSVGMFVLCLGISNAPGCATTSQPGPYGTNSSNDRDPLRAQSLTLQAAELIESDPERAKKLLREALAADIYHGPAHNNYGVLHLKVDRLYEAASEFEWARKLMPGHPDPRMNLALTLERAGKVDEALATYGSALETYPDHIPTMQALARLQIRRDRIDPRTPQLLEGIALEGETAQWREWAQREMIRIRGRRSS